MIQREEPFGRYTNPFKLKKKIRLTRLAPMALVTLIFVWVVSLLFLPYFRVTHVQYSGFKIIKQEELSGVVSKEFLSSSRWWPRNNYFLI